MSLRDQMPESAAIVDDLRAMLGRELVDAAIVAGAGKSAGAYVAKAESIALKAGDRPAFEALLRQALRVSAEHRDLPNEVMRERAQWLLATADDLF